MLRYAAATFTGFQNMARLTVRGFICIDQADLELTPFTVLIGPQGSGKSVVAKLAYFCYEALTAWTFPEPDRSLDDYSASLCRQFTDLFPPSTWGRGKFLIALDVGDYRIELTPAPRREYAVAVSFSPHFRVDFEELRLATAEALGGDPPGSQNALKPEFSKRYQLLREVSEAFVERAADSCGADYVSGLTFIPAGRTLFSHIGRLARASQATHIPLDPITSRFGELIEVLRDHFGRFPEAYESLRDSDRMRALFGGRLVFDEEGNRLEMDDGRTIPFAFLSSGAQELLPLFLAIRIGLGGSLLFIEEPEAHLFPSTQSRLIEVLAELIGETTAPRLFVTTHSPYTLAKLNNLIKAGAVAALGDAQEKLVSQIAPRRAWLRKGAVSAYAIQDRVVVPIMDEDGLINASYIDSISDDISNQFLELLEVEYPDAD